MKYKGELKNMKVMVCCDSLLYVIRQRQILVMICKHFFNGFMALFIHENAHFLNNTQYYWFKVYNNLIIPRKMSMVISSYKGLYISKIQMWPSNSRKYGLSCKYFSEFHNI
jgi:hypothetical protein